MIPPTVITDLLKKLIEELACDVTSADVRCSVFKVSLSSECKIVIVISTFLHEALVSRPLKVKDSNCSAE